MPQGEGGSLRCHTKVTGPEKEVRWERRAQPCWFKMFIFSMMGSSDQLFFICSGSVNRQHRLGRRNKSQRAPLPTGAKHIIGNLFSPCACLVSDIYFIYFSLYYILLVFTAPRKSRCTYTFFFPES